MRLLVTGASSFVGAHFCRHAAREHEVVAVHYSTPLALPGVSPLRADLRRERDRRRLEEVRADAIVHLACKIQEPGGKGVDPSKAAAGTNRAMMDTVLSLGLPVVYASSTVVHWATSTPYGESRREDEARLASSGLPWVALRPSAPYGPKLLLHHPRHRESFHTLAALVRTSPVVPVIGDGRYRRQPIHVDDFSTFLLALLRGPLPGRAFDAGGADALSMNEIIREMGRAARRRPLLLHLPKALFVALARKLPDLDPQLIAAADQDEVADPGALIAATGHRPRPFAEGVRDLFPGTR